MLAIGAAVFLSLTVGRQLLRLARQPEAFRAWIDGCGPWAPLCLIGLMCFQVVVAVLPGEPIEIGAGVAFGVWQGLGLCLIGAALGSGRYKMAVWIFVGSVALGLVGAVYYRQLVKKEQRKKRWEDEAKAKQQALKAQQRACARRTKGV